MPDTSIIVMSYMRDGRPALPHMAHLQRSNPGVPIFLCCNRDNGDPHLEWRNSDRRLRDWWFNFGRNVLTDKVIVLEWDVLVTIKLPGFDCDFGGREFKTPVSDPHWKWFEETTKLENQAPPLGVVPLAVTFWKRRALDFLCDRRWDYLYRKDIFCELRMASVVGSIFPLTEIPMPHVDWKLVNPTKEPGIYHAVKEAYNA